jgi:hypothetical protein
MKNRILIALTIASWVLASCELPEPIKRETASPAENGPAENLPTDAPEPAKPSASAADRQVRVEITPGQEAVLNVLPAAPKTISDQMAPFIRDAGFPCDSVIEANQLQQQDGQTVPIFKIECSGGYAYQASMIGEKSYIKPWTGVLLGG